MKGLIFVPRLSVPLFKAAELKALSDGKMGATKERAARIKRALEIAIGYMNNDNEDRDIVLAAIRKARGEA